MNNPVDPANFDAVDQFLQAIINRTQQPPVHAYPEMVDISQEEAQTIQNAIREAKAQANEVRRLRTILGKARSLIVQSRLTNAHVCQSREVFQAKTVLENELQSNDAS